MEELKKLIETLQKAFEEYKAANDARLEEIKKGGSGAGFEEKLTRLEAEIKRVEEEKAALEAKMNRPGAVGAKSEHDAVSAEHKNAFLGWMRKGDSANLADLEVKAMNLGVEADGGYAIPEVMSTQIYSLLQQACPMRGVCRNITVGNEEYRELVNLHGANSNWVGETDARPATDTPALTEVRPFMGEISATPEATQKSLDDIFFDVESWLAEEVSSVFALAENAAFTSGDGSKKPKGLLAYPTAATADGPRAFGTLQHLKTGVATGLPADTPADLLIDVIHALKPGYRRGGRWMLNNATLAVIRKWKDKEDNYLWQPSIQVGVPSMLFGYPLTENEDMPDIKGNALCLAFGDFQRAYTVVDRVGIRALRDPYTHKPYVGFYTTKRVGGFLKDSEAVKLVKCAA